MSFQTGLSGLNASSRNLDVIGNNIANANTTGMKSSRAEFTSLYTTALGVGSGSSTGIGVAIANVAQQFTQGNITITGNGLDVAINGGGFFQLRMPDGTSAYTRDGSFKLDKNGNLVTNAGAFVMGYPTDKTGKPTSATAQALTLPTAAPIGANATSTISAVFNLDARAPLAAGVPASAGPPPVAAIPPTPLTTYGTSLTVYDSQGTAIPITVYMQKTGTDTWEVFTDPTSAATATATKIATLNFSTNGTLTSTTPASPTISIVSPNTNIGTFTAALDLSKVTQYGNNFQVSNITQDGYPSGDLVGVKVNESGVIMANYSNGQTQAAGQIGLADFRNIQGLSPNQGNTWIETFASGQPVQGAPGVGRFGALRAGSLEDSNVDLTAELVNMMTAQRAYQANAQTIKTQDQVLSTLVNMR